MADGDRWMLAPAGEGSPHRWRYFIPDWWAFGPDFPLNEIELGLRPALWLEEARLG